MHPRRHWPGSAPRQSATLALAPWASSLRRRRATNSDSQEPTLQAIRRIVEVVDPVLTDVQGDAHRSRAIFESVGAFESCVRGLTQHSNPGSIGTSRPQRTLIGG